MEFPRRALAATALCATFLTACGTPAAEDAPTSQETGAAGTTSSAEASASPSEQSLEGTELTVVTHDSFAVPEDLLNGFEEETGMSVEIVQPGDGGALVNQLVLTKDSPLGDVVFGIDNTFATRAMDEGVIEPYNSEALPAESSQFSLDGLTSVDFGDVCINADLTWFEKKGQPVPTTLEDLADPAYKDLLVVTNPASSSPGLAFLLATISAEGEGWKDYWTQLKDNGVKVAQDWSEAYYSDFTAAADNGERPLVLSYATSPAFTMDEEGTASTTAALLGTCFRQIEYAGVIEGADNPEGAKAFIDFLISPEVQASIPENMYMYPVDSSVELPAEWQQFAPLSPHPLEVTPEDIDAHREQWIQEWTDTVLQ